MFKRKENKPEILGYYVQYSRETAKINPAMIEDAYKKKIKELKNEIETLKGKPDNLKMKTDSVNFHDIESLNRELESVINLIYKTGSSTIDFNYYMFIPYSFLKQFKNMNEEWDRLYQKLDELNQKKENAEKEYKQFKRKFL